MIGRLLTVLVIVSVVGGPSPLPLCAPMVTELTPGPVGVPEITPVEVFTLNPAGNPVALKLVGVFVAVIV